jgi:phosphocarrier protein
MSGADSVGDVVRQTVLIANKRGLHARASAKFVTLASTQDASVEVEKDGSGSVAGTSIMGLMMLGAAKGDHVTISCSGAKADEALAVLVALVEDKFGEE